MEEPSYYIHQYPVMKLSGLSNALHREVSLMAYKGVMQGKIFVMLYRLHAVFLLNTKHTKCCQSSIQKPPHYPYGPDVCAFK